MGGSGPDYQTLTPSRRCARAYYCQTHDSTKWAARRGLAPSHSTGAPAPRGMSKSSRVYIGKIPVDRIGLADMLRIVAGALASGQQRTIFYANSHAVTLAETDPEFAAAMNGADTVFCDGFGAYFASRLLGSPIPERFSWPDWIVPLGGTCRDNGSSMFFLGAKEGVAQTAANKMEREVPGLRVHSHHGHFPKDDRSSRRIIEQINRSGAKVLLVGFGMPLQEL